MDTRANPPARPHPPKAGHEQPRAASVESAGRQGDTHLQRWLETSARYLGLGPLEAARRLD